MAGRYLDISDRIPKKLTFAERLYLPYILGGMAVTIGHFARNLRYQLPRIWRKLPPVGSPGRLPTIEYPDEKRNYSDRFRGKHVLKAREDGTLKCVACYMCAQACPAECITIVAGEHPKLAYEKYPVLFEIDMLRCVFCGYCVDACPKDAIWMTRNYELTFKKREDAVFGIDKLSETPGEEPYMGWGYRPYYPGDGTVPPADASVELVIPGDGGRFLLREKGQLPTHPSA
jgi:NADH-quinone oxidoreductase subunit I